MIYLECYADKTLVRTLGIPRKDIVHAGTKGDVCKGLRKNKNSKGLVDEDPGSPPPSYVNELKPQSNANNVEIRYDQTRKNHLIILSPRLEEWLLKAAREAGVSPSDYGLPEDADKLKELPKTRLMNLERFIKEILKQKSQMIRTLERFLKGKFELKGGKDELD